MSPPGLTWAVLLLLVPWLSAGQAETEDVSHEYYDEYEEEPHESYQVNVPDSFKSYLEELLVRGDDDELQVKNSSSESPPLNKKIEDVLQHENTSYKQRHSLNEKQYGDKTLISLTKNLQSIPQTIHRPRPIIVHPYGKSNISHLLSSLAKHNLSSRLDTNMEKTSSSIFDKNMKNTLSSILDGEMENNSTSRVENNMENTYSSILDTNTENTSSYGLNEKMENTSISAPNKNKGTTFSSRLDNIMKDTSSSSLDENMGNIYSSSLERRKGNTTDNRLNENVENTSSFSLTENDEKTSSSRLDKILNDTSSSRLDENMNGTSTSIINDKVKNMSGSVIDENLVNTSSSILEQNMENTTDSRLDENKENTYRSTLDEKVENTSGSRLDKDVANTYSSRLDQNMEHTSDFRLNENIEEPSSSILDKNNENIFGFRLNENGENTSSSRLNENISDTSRSTLDEKFENNSGSRLDKNVVNTYGYRLDQNMENASRSILDDNIEEPSSSILEKNKDNTSGSRLDENEEHTSSSRRDKNVANPSTSSLDEYNENISGSIVDENGNNTPSLRLDENVDNTSFSLNDHENKNYVNEYNHKNDIEIGNKLELLSTNGSSVAQNKVLSSSNLLTNDSNTYFPEIHKQFGSNLANTEKSALVVSEIERTVNDSSFNDSFAQSSSHNAVKKDGKQSEINYSNLLDKTEPNHRFHILEPLSKTTDDTVTYSGLINENINRGNSSQGGESNDRTINTTHSIIEPAKDLNGNSSTIFKENSIRETNNSVASSLEGIAKRSMDFGGDYTNSVRNTNEGRLKNNFHLSENKDLAKNISSDTNIGSNEELYTKVYEVTNSVTDLTNNAFNTDTKWKINSNGNTLESSVGTKEDSETTNNSNTSFTIPDLIRNDENPNLYDSFTSADMLLQNDKSNSNVSSLTTEDLSQLSLQTQIRNNETDHNVKSEVGNQDKRLKGKHIKTNELQQFNYSGEYPSTNSEMPKLDESKNIHRPYGPSPLQIDFVTNGEPAMKEESNSNNKLTVSQRKQLKNQSASNLGSVDGNSSTNKLRKSIINNIYLNHKIPSGSNKEEFRFNNRINSNVFDISKKNQVKDTSTTYNNPLITNKSNERGFELREDNNMNNNIIHNFSSSEVSNVTAINSIDNGKYVKSYKANDSKNDNVIKDIESYKEKIKNLKSNELAKKVPQSTRKKINKPGRIDLAHFRKILDGILGNDNKTENKPFGKLQLDNDQLDTVGQLGTHRIDSTLETNSLNNLALEPRTININKNSLDNLTTTNNATINKTSTILTDVKQTTDSAADSISRSRSDDFINNTNKSNTLNINLEKTYTNNNVNETNDYIGKKNYENVNNNKNLSKTDIVDYFKNDNEKDADSNGSMLYYNKDLKENNSSLEKKAEHNPNTPISSYHYNEDFVSNDPKSTHIHSNNARTNSTSMDANSVKEMKFRGVKELNEISNTFNPDEKSMESNNVLATQNSSHLFDSSTVHTKNSVEKDLINKRNSSILNLSNAENRLTKTLSKSKEPLSVPKTNLTMQNTVTVKNTSSILDNKMETRFKKHPIEELLESYVKIPYTSKTLKKRKRKRKMKQKTFKNDTITSLKEPGTISELVRGTKVNKSRKLRESENKTLTNISQTENTQHAIVENGGYQLNNDETSVSDNQSHRKLARTPSQDMDDGASIFKGQGTNGETVGKFQVHNKNSVIKTNKEQTEVFKKKLKYLTSPYSQSENYISKFMQSHKAFNTRSQKPIDYSESNVEQPQVSSIFRYIKGKQPQNYFQKTNNIENEILNTQIPNNMLSNSNSLQSTTSNYNLLTQDHHSQDQRAIKRQPNYQTNSETVQSEITNHVKSTNYEQKQDMTSVNSQPVGNIVLQAQNNYLSNIHDFPSKNKLFVISDLNNSSLVGLKDINTIQSKLSKNPQYSLSKQSKQDQTFGNMNHMRHSVKTQDSNDILSSKDKQTQNATPVTTHTGSGYHQSQISKKTQSTQGVKKQHETSGYDKNKFDTGYSDISNKIQTTENEEKQDHTSVNIHTAGGSVNSQIVKNVNVKVGGKTKIQRVTDDKHGNGIVQSGEPNSTKSQPNQPTQKQTIIHGQKDSESAHTQRTNNIRATTNGDIVQAQVTNNILSNDGELTKDKTLGNYSKAYSSTPRSQSTDSMLLNAGENTHDHVSGKSHTHSSVDRSQTANNMLLNAGEHTHDHISGNSQAHSSVDRPHTANNMLLNAGENMHDYISGNSQAHSSVDRSQTANNMLLNAGENTHDHILGNSHSQSGIVRSQTANNMLLNAGENTHDHILGNSHTQSGIVRSQTANNMLLNAGENTHDHILGNSHSQSGIVRSQTANNMLLNAGENTHDHILGNSHTQSGIVRSQTANNMLLNAGENTHNHISGNSQAHSSVDRSQTANNMLLNAGEHTYDQTSGKSQSQSDIIRSKTANNMLLNAGEHTYDQTSENSESQSDIVGSQIEDNMSGKSQSQSDIVRSKTADNMLLNAGEHAYNQTSGSSQSENDIVQSQIANNIISNARDLASDQTLENSRKYDNINSKVGNNTLYHNGEWKDNQVTVHRQTDKNIAQPKIENKILDEHTQDQISVNNLMNGQSEGEIDHSYKSNSFQYNINKHTNNQSSIKNQTMKYMVEPQLTNQIQSALEESTRLQVPVQSFTNNNMFQTQLSDNMLSNQAEYALDKKAVASQVDSSLFRLQDVNNKLHSRDGQTSDETLVHDSQSATGASHSQSSYTKQYDGNVSSKDLPSDYSVKESQRSQPQIPNSVFSSVGNRIQDESLVNSEQSSQTNSESVSSNLPNNLQSFGNNHKQFDNSKKYQTETYILDSQTSNNKTSSKDLQTQNLTPTNGKSDSSVPQYQTSQNTTPTQDSLTEYQPEYDGKKEIDLLQSKLSANANTITEKYKQDKTSENRLLYRNHVESEPTNNIGYKKEEQNKEFQKIDSYILNPKLLSSILYKTEEHTLTDKSVGSKTNSNTVQSTDADNLLFMQEDHTADETVVGTNTGNAIVQSQLQNNTISSENDKSLQDNASLNGKIDNGIVYSQILNKSQYREGEIETFQTPGNGNTVQSHVVNNIFNSNGERIQNETPVHGQRSLYSLTPNILQPTESELKEDQSAVNGQGHKGILESQLSKNMQPEKIEDINNQISGDIITGTSNVQTHISNNMMSAEGKQNNDQIVIGGQQGSEVVQSEILSNQQSYKKGQSADQSSVNSKKGRDTYSLKPNRVNSEHERDIGQSQVKNVIQSTHGEQTQDQKSVLSQTNRNNVHSRIFNNMKFTQDELSNDEAVNYQAQKVVENSSVNNNKLSNNRNDSLIQIRTNQSDTNHKGVNRQFENSTVQPHITMSHGLTNVQQGTASSNSRKEHGIVHSLNNNTNALTEEQDNESMNGKTHMVDESTSNGIIVNSEQREKTGRLETRLVSEQGRNDQESVFNAASSFNNLRRIENGNFNLVTENVNMVQPLTSNADNLKGEDNNKNYTEYNSFVSKHPLREQPSIFKVVYPYINHSKEHETTNSNLFIEDGQADQSSSNHLYERKDRTSEFQNKNTTLVQNNESLIIVPPLPYQTRNSTSSDQQDGQKMRNYTSLVEQELNDEQVGSNILKLSPESELRTGNGAVNVQNVNENQYVAQTSGSNTLGASEVEEKSQATKVQEIKNQIVTQPDNESKNNSYSLTDQEKYFHNAEDNSFIFERGSNDSPVKSILKLPSKDNNGSEYFTANENRLVEVPQSSNLSQSREQISRKSNLIMQGIKDQEISNYDINNNHTTVFNKQSVNSNDNSVFRGVNLSENDKSLNTVNEQLATDTKRPGDSLKSSSKYLSNGVNDDRLQISENNLSEVAREHNVNPLSHNIAYSSQTNEKHGYTTGESKSLFENERVVQPISSDARLISETEEENKKAHNTILLPVENGMISQSNVLSFRNNSQVENENYQSSTSKQSGVEKKLASEPIITNTRYSDTGIQRENVIMGSQNDMDGVLHRIPHNNLNYLGRRVHKIDQHKKQIFENGSKRSENIEITKLRNEARNENAEQSSNPDLYSIKQSGFQRNDFGRRIILNNQQSQHGVHQIKHIEERKHMGISRPHHTFRNTLVQGSSFQAKNTGMDEKLNVFGKHIIKKYNKNMQFSNNGFSHGSLQNQRSTGIAKNKQSLRNNTIGEITQDRNKISKSSTNDFSQGLFQEQTNKITSNIAQSSRNSVIQRLNKNKRNSLYSSSKTGNIQSGFNRSKIHIILTPTDKVPNMTVQIGVETDDNSNKSYPVQFNINDYVHSNGSGPISKIELNPHPPDSSKHSNIHEKFEGIKFRSLPMGLTTLREKSARRLNRSSIKSGEKNIADKELPNKDPPLEQRPSAISDSKEANPATTTKPVFKKNQDPVQNITTPSVKSNVNATPGENETEDSSGGQLTSSPNVKSSASNENDPKNKDDRNVTVDIKDKDRVTSRKRISKNEEIVEIDEKVSKNKIIGKSKSVKKIKTEISSVDYV